MNVRRPGNATMPPSGVSPSYGTPSVYVTDSEESSADDVSMTDVGDFLSPSGVPKSIAYASQASDNKNNKRKGSGNGTGQPSQKRNKGEEEEEEKVGTWYGKNREKLLVNNRFLNVVDEADSYFQAETDGKKIDYAARTAAARTYLIRALETVGLADRIGRLDPIEGVTARFLSPTVTADDQYANFNDHHGLNHYKTELGGGLDQGEEWAQQDLEERILRGEQEDQPRQSQPRQSQPSRRRGLFGGAEPRQKPPADLKDLLRRIGVNGTYTPYNDLQRLQKDAELGYREITNWNNEPIYPVMVPGKDLTENPRIAIRKLIRTATRALDLQFDTVRATNNVNDLKRMAEVLANRIDLLRGKAHLFLTTYIDNDIPIKLQTSEEKKRWKCKVRNIREIIPTVFALRLVHAMRLEALWKLYRAEAISTITLLRAEETRLQAWKIHERIWNEYDGCRYFQLKAEHMMSHVRQRVDRRRILIATWDQDIARINDAIETMEKNPDAFPTLSALLANQTASGEQPSGEQPSGAPPPPTSQQPPGRQPSGKQPSGVQPSGKQPSGAQPSGEQPSGEQPSGKQPSGKQPSGEQSPWKQPSGEQPSGSLPGTLKELTSSNFTSAGGNAPPPSSFNLLKNLLQSKNREDSSEQPEQQTEDNSTVPDRQNAANRANTIDIASLIHARNDYENEIARVKQMNADLDEYDPGDHQHIELNNIDIMAKNQVVAILDKEIAAAQAADPFAHDVLGAGVHVRYTAPPVDTYYRDTTRIPPPRRLPLGINSLAGGPLPGEHPVPGLTRVLVGTPAVFGYSSPDDLSAPSDPTPGPINPSTALGGNTLGQAKPSGSTEQAEPPAHGDETSSEVRNLDWSYDRMIKEKKAWLDSQPSTYYTQRKDDNKMVQVYNTEVYNKALRDAYRRDYGQELDSTKPTRREPTASAQDRPDRSKPTVTVQETQPEIRNLDWSFEKMKLDKAAWIGSQPKGYNTEDAYGKAVIDAYKRDYGRTPDSDESVRGTSLASRKPWTVLRLDADWEGFYRSVTRNKRDAFREVTEQSGRIFESEWDKCGMSNRSLNEVQPSVVGWTLETFRKRSFEDFVAATSFTPCQVEGTYIEGLITAQMAYLQERGRKWTSKQTNEGLIILARAGLLTNQKKLEEAGKIWRTYMKTVAAILAGGQERAHRFRTANTGPTQDTTQKPGPDTTQKPGPDTAQKPGPDTTTKKPGSDTVQKPQQVTTQGNTEAPKPDTRQWDWNTVASMNWRQYHSRLPPAERTKENESKTREDWNNIKREALRRHQLGLSSVVEEPSKGTQQAGNSKVDTTITTVTTNNNNNGSSRPPKPTNTGPTTSGNDWWSKPPVPPTGVRVPPTPGVTNTTQPPASGTNAAAPGPGPNTSNATTTAGPVISDPAAIWLTGPNYQNGLFGPKPGKPGKPRVTISNGERPDPTDPLGIRKNTGGTFGTGTTPTDLSSIFGAKPKPKTRGIFGTGVTQEDLDEYLRIRGKPDNALGGNTTPKGPGYVLNNTTNTGGESDNRKPGTDVPRAPYSGETAVDNSAGVTPQDTIEEKPKEEAKAEEEDTNVEKKDEKKVAVGQPDGNVQAVDLDAMIPESNGWSDLRRMIYYYHLADLQQRVLAQRIPPPVYGSAGYCSEVFTPEWPMPIWLSFRDEDGDQRWAGDL
ncbi:hypothetical protein F5B20DRAFT_420624 [Whalleya microplaca]|nr:hypothetical protein F5B20DRAFT_420624 [Whalleya microplaca]